MTSLAAVVLSGGWISWVTDPAPADKDVKAGWVAFAVFLLLVGSVVLLSMSLVKHLRRANAAQDAGVFGEAVEDDEETETPAAR